jgi:CheY-like chemotaxis protein
MSPPRLMLVEDTDADAEVVHRAVAACLPGARLRWLRTRREAVEVLRSGEALPDLVLLDLTLPDASGLALLVELRRDPGTARVPVVVLTSSTRQSEVDAAYDAGAHGFVTKPSSPVAAMEALRQVCEYWFGPVRRPGGPRDRPGEGVP